MVCFVARFHSFMVHLLSLALAAWPCSCPLELLFLFSRSQGTSFYQRFSEAKSAKQLGCYTHGKLFCFALVRNQQRNSYRFCECTMYVYVLYQYFRHRISMEKTPPWLKTTNIEKEFDFIEFLLSKNSCE